MDIKTISPGNRCPRSIQRVVEAGGVLECGKGFRRLEGNWEVEHIVNKMSTALRFEYSEVEVGNLDMIVTTIICD